MLVRTSHLAAVQGFDQVCMERIYLWLWLPMIQFARKEGLKTVELELGDKNQRSTQEFLMAGTCFLSKLGIPHFPILVREKGRVPRIILSVSV